MFFDDTTPVLVVAAHHDDEVLGAGGTIARLSKSGRPVTVAILGEGPTSRAPEADSSAREKAQDRQARSAESASAMLGVNELVLGGFPDNRFDTMAMLDLARWIERILERVQPALVLTHSGSDLNVDHVRTLQAVLTAARPQAGTPVKTILSFEVPSSTEWGFRALGSTFNPNCFLDIASTLEDKMKALECYENEMREDPHPRSFDGVRRLASLRGATVGLTAAEAFEVVRIQD